MTRPTEAEVRKWLCYPPSVEGGTALVSPRDFKRLAEDWLATELALREVAARISACEPDQPGFQVCDIFGTLLRLHGLWRGEVRSDA